MDDYPENEPRRRSSTWLIGIIIAAVAFFLFFMHSEKNPITGEKQYVSISPQQEVRLGLQAAPQMAAQMGGEISSSDARTQLVHRIGNEIIQKSNAHEGPWQFQFHLLADPKTVNAFALPGGQIFITLGLLNRLQTEAQLAGVLAHETGHVIQRHSAQQMAKSQLGQLLVLATGIGLSDSNHPDRARQSAMIASVVNQMTQLRYSRKDELEADEWGIRLMREAGYTPQAMIEVMEILEKAVPGGHQPEMLLTHPYPKNRMEKIQEYIQAHPIGANLREGRNIKDLIDTDSTSDEDFSRQPAFQ